MAMTQTNIGAGNTAVAFREVARTHIFGFDAGVGLPIPILQGGRNCLLSRQVRMDAELTDHESKQGNQDDDAKASPNPKPHPIDGSFKRCTAIQL